MSLKNERGIFGASAEEVEGETKFDQPGRCLQGGRQVQGRQAQRRGVVRGPAQDRQRQSKVSFHFPRDFFLISNVISLRAVGLFVHKTKNEAEDSSSPNNPFVMRPFVVPDGFNHLRDSKLQLEPFNTERDTKQYSNRRDLNKFSQWQRLTVL